MNTTQTSVRETMAKQSSDHVRSVGRNAVVYGLGLVLGRIGAFLLLPLYTHCLSVADFGILSTLLVTNEILFVFMHLGLRTAVLRYLPDAERAGDSGRLLGSALVLNVLGGAAVTAIVAAATGPFFVRVLHRPDVAPYLLLSCGAAFAGSMFFIVISYFRARNEAGRYVLSGVAVSVLQLAGASAALLVFGAGVKGVLVAIIGAYAAPGVWIAARIFRRIGVGWSRALAGRLLRFGFPLVFAMSGSLITEASTVYVLGFFRPLDDVAVYSLGNKIAMIAYVFLVSPFQIAYEPFVFSRLDDPAARRSIGRLLTYLLVLFAFASFVIVLVARPLIAVIAPPEYASAFLVVVLLLPAVLSLGVYYVGEALLNAKRRTPFLATTVAVFAALSIGMNIGAIPLWGLFGAVATRNVILGARALTILGAGCRAFPIEIEWPRLRLAVLLYAVFSATALIAGRVSLPWFYAAGGTVLAVSAVALARSGLWDAHEKEMLAALVRRVMAPARPS